MLKNELETHASQFFLLGQFFIFYIRFTLYPIFSGLIYFLDLIQVHRVFGCGLPSRDMAVELGVWLRDQKPRGRDLRQTCGSLAFALVDSTKDVEPVAACRRDCRRLSFRSWLSGNRRCCGEAVGRHYAADAVDQGVDLGLLRPKPGQLPFCWDNRAGSVKLFCTSSKVCGLWPLRAWGT